MGILSCVLPEYAFGTLARDLRGTAISLIQFGSAVGLLFVFAAGYLFREALLTERYFRLVWVLELLPAFLLLLISFGLRETPVWLARTGQWAVAAAYLRKVKKHKELPPQVEAAERAVGEIDDCATRHQQLDKDLVLAVCELSEAALQKRDRHLFHKKQRKHLLFAVMSIAISQISGVTIVTRVFSEICHACGIRFDLNFTASIVQCSLQAAFALLPVLLLDKCRRKDVMVLGMFGIAMTHFGCWIFILLFGNGGDDLSTPFGRLVPGNLATASTIIALTAFVVIVYSITLPSGSVLYACELLQDVHRNFGLSISMGAYWLLRGLLGYLIQMCFQFIGSWTWLILASLCFAGGFFLTLFPETLMLSGPELELLFESNEPVCSIYQTVLISEDKSVQTLLQKSDLLLAGPGGHSMTTSLSKKTHSGLLFKEKLRPDLLPLQLSDSTDESWNIGDEWVYGSLRAVPCPGMSGKGAVGTGNLLDTLVESTCRLNGISPVRGQNEFPDTETRALLEYPTVKIRKELLLETATSTERAVTASDGCLTNTANRSPHLDPNFEMAKLESSGDLEDDFATTNASADRHSNQDNCRRLRRALRDGNSGGASLLVDEYSFGDFYNKSSTAHGGLSFPEFEWLQHTSALLEKTE